MPVRVRQGVLNATSYSHGTGDVLEGVLGAICEIWADNVGIWGLTDQELMKRLGMDQIILTAISGTFLVVWPELFYPVCATFTSNTYGSNETFKHVQAHPVLGCNKINHRIRARPSQIQ